MFWFSGAPRIIGKDTQLMYLNYLPRRGGKPVGDLGRGKRAAVS
jgi:hypothetical protein